MKLYDLQVGMIGTNCYVLCDEQAKVCAVIDPGEEAARIWSVVEKSGCVPQYIFLTHGHWDHTTGVDGFLKKTALPVYIHRADAIGPGERGDHKYAANEHTRYYDEGDTLPLGALTVEVLHTPGHSPGSVTLRIGDALFTGDTLFRDSCGRTDLPGGSYEEILASLRRLSELPGDYRVYPGHEAFTTLERERARNYFLHEALAP